MRKAVSNGLIKGPYELVVELSSPYYEEIELAEVYNALNVYYEDSVLLIKAFIDDYELVNDLVNKVKLIKSVYLLSKNQNDTTVGVKYYTKNDSETKFSIDLEDQSILVLNVRLDISTVDVGVQYLESFAELTEEDREEFKEKVDQLNEKNKG